MSESSPEAERVDESAFGAGGESSIDADLDASGAGSEGADESVADSYAADVAAGYDDPADAPVQDDTEEDGRL